MGSMDLTQYCRTAWDSELGLGKCAQRAVVRTNSRARSRKGTLIRVCSWHSGKTRHQHTKRVILDGPGLWENRRISGWVFSRYLFTSRCFHRGQLGFLTPHPTFVLVISVQQRLTVHRHGNLKSPSKGISHGAAPSEATEVHVESHIFVHALSALHPQPG